MSMRAVHVFRTVPLVVLLASCVVPSDTTPLVPEASAVWESRSAMIGMNTNDVRMCAGLPTRELELPGDVEIWSYKRDSRRSGMYVSLPTLTGGPFSGTAGSVTTASTGTCSAQVLFENDRVKQVEFAGDNNGLRSLNQLCVPVVDGCVRYAQRGMSAPEEVIPQPDPVPEDGDDGDR